MLLGMLQCIWECLDAPVRPSAEPNRCCARLRCVLKSVCVCVSLGCLTAAEDAHNVLELTQMENYNASDQRSSQKYYSAGFKKWYLKQHVVARLVFNVKSAVI